jgi:hypothetical protein
MKVTTHEMESQVKATKQSIILALAIAGMTRIAAFNELRAMVIDQIDPMIFTFNPGGGQRRRPKTIPAQLIDLRNQINRTYSANGYADDGTLKSTDEIGSGSEYGNDDESQSDEIKSADNQSGIIDDGRTVPVIDEKPVKPVASGKVKTRNELDFFRSETIRLRAFCNDMQARKRPVDEISSRPDEAAGKLIPRGIPARALLDAMTFHWNEAQREDARIQSFDFTSLSQSIMTDRGLTDEWADLLASNDRDHEPLHDMFGYVLVLAEARQPIYLFGPKGTGKSHIARQLAYYLRTDYSETPMSLGANRGDLLGRFTASSEKPFITASFSDVYANGGVFNFEEMDASDPGMLIVLNNAMAGQSFYNSNFGERLDRSPDFIGVATANTLANGDPSIYKREALDPATLDRWNMGRVRMEHDQRVSDYLLYRYV